MTYILGWKNYSSVFLVGDSVITFEHSKSLGNKNTFRDKSTFGEENIYQEGKTISETYLKLYDLNNKVILAFSGEIGDLYEGIKFFQLYLEKNSDIKSGIEICFKDIGVGIIVGYMDEDVPRLVSFNCMGNSGFLEHSFFKVVHSGSPDSTFVDQTEEFFSQINGKDWTDDQILTSIIGVTQSFGFQENIYNQGIGGFFSGIRIDKNGVTWQKDLAFVPFAYNGKELKSNKLAEIFGEAKIVMTQVRESILFSCSPFQDDIRKARRPFANFRPEGIVNSEEWKKERFKWFATWGEEVNSNCDDFNGDYFIFYNTRKPIVSLVYSNREKPFEIGDGKITFKPEEFRYFIEILSSSMDDNLTFYSMF